MAKEKQFDIFDALPAAFAVHKLIISARRMKPEKHQKDLETAIEMLNYVFFLPKSYVISNPY